MLTPSAELRREGGWLLGTAVAALVAGVLTGWAVWLLPLALALHSVWLLWRIERLARWLGDGARAAKAPPTVGLGNRVVELVHRMRNDSRKQKRKHKNVVAQFNDLAAALPDATVVLDAQHQIRWANAAAKALLNIDPERDRGQRIDNLVRVPGFMEGSMRGEGGQDLEIELPSGSGRTLAIRMVPSGNRTSMLIARDVTQRVRLREMRKRFVDDVSHELRTPLTVIGGYVEMLRDGDASLEPSARDALGHVAEHTGRMRRIVEDLLQLSRLEGEPLALSDGETVAVPSLLRTIVADAAATRPDVDATRFSLDVDGTLALRGLDAALWSAFNNLVVNALKYGGDGTIDVAWGRDPAGRPLLRVLDRGPGIEPRHLPRLSERFYRVDRHRARDSGGTGLGLAIVKHAAKLHGGELSIRSVPGSGSTFSIAFPAGRAVTLEAPAHEGGSARDEATAPGTGQSGEAPYATPYGVAHGVADGATGDAAGHVELGAGRAAS